MGGGRAAAKSARPPGSGLHFFLSSLLFRARPPPRAHAPPKTYPTRSLVWLWWRTKRLLRLTSFLALVKGATILES